MTPHWTMRRLQGMSRRRPQVPKTLTAHNPAGPALGSHHRLEVMPGQLAAHCLPVAAWDHASPHNHETVTMSKVPARLAPERLPRCRI